MVSRLGAGEVHRHAPWKTFGLSYSRKPGGGFKTNKQCVDTNIQRLNRDVFKAGVH